MLEIKNKYKNKIVEIRSRPLKRTSSAPPPASWMPWNSLTSRANKQEKFVLPKLDYILECIWMEPCGAPDEVMDDVAVGSLSADRVQSDVASKARSKGTKPRSVKSDFTLF